MSSGVLDASLEIAISGMTCASCASRVERKLNRCVGVSAAVNYATGLASVTYDPALAAPADLVRTVEGLGYGASVPAVDPGARAKNDDEHLGWSGETRRLVICVALSLPVLLLAMVPQLQFDGWRLSSLILGTPVAFWGAWPFHRASIVNARHGSATMDTLVSVGIASAWLWSLYALTFGDTSGVARTHGMRMQMPGMHMSMPTSAMSLIPSRGAGADSIYLEVAAVMTSLILLGRWLESRARRRAGDALDALSNLGAKQANLIDNGVERSVPIEQLLVGQRFAVVSGEKVATDGIVERGRATIDTSMLTGEALPVEVGPGSVVTGATLNTGGSLVVEATRVGPHTMLAQITRLVSDALAAKAPIQRLADRISAVFVPAVFALATVTFVVWKLTGGSTGLAAMSAIAVLVAACPCALGLATPIALIVGASRGAQLGLLIRGPQILEEAHRVNTVVFDKTGTLTMGEMSLAAITAEDGTQREELMAILGALESSSEHPIARAIVRATPTTGQHLSVSGLVSHDGIGVEGTINGRLAIVGRPDFLTERGMVISPSLQAAQRAAEARGQSVVAVGWEGQCRGVLGIADQIKPSAAAAVTKLRRMGLGIVLLSGDNLSATRAVAAELGIEEVIAGVLPSRKAEVIQQLKRDRRRVAMVGDGVNDAPALAAADLGLAIGTGAEVAIRASDLTLVSGDPLGVADALQLARATFRTIRQNLTWAFVYNLAVLPLAASGFLDPMIAGAAMGLSSVSVVANSLRLRRFEPLHAGSHGWWRPRSAAPAQLGPSRRTHSAGSWPA
jgi:Cu+-exporting ATPase